MYVEFRKGNSRAVESLQDVLQVIVSTITLGELLAGLAIRNGRDANKPLVDLLSRPRARVVQVTEETVEHYAQIYVYLRSMGKMIPTNDLWIATSALEHDAELLTTDAHFLQVPHILVNHFDVSP